MKGFKIKIQIQSISDIITNSSSEVFCMINSRDEEIKKRIYEYLKNDLFPGKYSDEEPTVDYWDDEDNDEIQIWLPYDHCSSLTFYKAGIEAILNEKFGKNNYTIEYNED